MPSEGPNSPATAAFDDSFGDIMFFYSGIDNIKVDDDTSAQVVVFSGGGGNTNYFKATNFGFSVPGNATILGIEAKIKRQRDSIGGGSIKDERVRIVKGGVIGTEEKADTVTMWPGTLTLATYGGEEDLWGEDWTPDDINANDFGFVVSAAITTFGGDEIANVDHMTLTVYFIDAGGHGGGHGNYHQTSIGVDLGI